jgi:hypothetical protein
MKFSSTKRPCILSINIEGGLFLGRKEKRKKGSLYGNEKESRSNSKRVRRMQNISFLYSGGGNLTLKMVYANKLLRKNT